MAKNTQSQVTSLDDETPDTAAQAVAEAEAPRVKGANHDAELSGNRRTITIHPTEGDGGSDAVPVAVNGFMYQIPRGKPFSVPVEVIEVLKNAKTTKYAQAPGGGVVESTVQRFAFSLE